MEREQILYLNSEDAACLLHRSRFCMEREQVLYLNSEDVARLLRRLEVLLGEGADLIPER